jgi:hypothetical protein
VSEPAVQLTAGPIPNRQSGVFPSGLNVTAVTQLVIWYRLAVSQLILGVRTERR